MKNKLQLFIGLAIIILGISLEVMWLGVCFGSIIIGILLLIFAPKILFFPFNFFLMVGLSVMTGITYQQGSGYRQYRNYNQFSGETVVDIDTYYATLESRNGDDLATVKKNYRRLIKQYHYDSLASQNLSDEEIKVAEEKTQALNEAYAAIKEHLKK